MFGTESPQGVSARFPNGGFIYCQNGRPDSPPTETVLLNVYVIFIPSSNILLRPEGSRIIPLGSFCRKFEPGLSSSVVAPFICKQQKRFSEQ